MGVRALLRPYNDICSSPTQVGVLNVAKVLAFVPIQYTQISLRQAMLSL